MDFCAMELFAAVAHSACGVPGEGLMQTTDVFSGLIGSAAVHLWSDLPREVQEKLFEHAVVIGHQRERDESLRERLAKFLHDHHKRTQQA
jgi:hypothetical protein